MTRKEDDLTIDDLIEKSPSEGMGMSQPPLPAEMVERRKQWAALESSTPADDLPKDSKDDSHKLSSKENEHPRIKRSPKGPERS